MRKIFGWVLIIMFILFSLLPVYYYTELVPAYPYYGMIEKTSQTWFLLVIPLEILLGENLAVNVGRLTGYFGILALGIWLVKKKEGKMAKGISGEEAGEKAESFVRREYGELIELRSRAERRGKA